MPTEVVLPSLGEADVDATVSRWLKAVGDSVKKGEPLLEVSTDKVDTEIPSPVDGVLLECRASEDDTVRLGDVVAVIGASAGPATTWPADPVATTPPAPVALPAPVVLPAPVPVAPAPAAPAPVVPPVLVTPPASRAATPPVDVADILNQHLNPTAPPQPARPLLPEAPAAEPAAEPPAEPYVTPPVRKLADQLGLDPLAVPGSGVGGRLRKQDLLDAAAPPPAPVADPRRGTTQTLSPTKAARAELATQTKLALTAGIEADLSHCHPESGDYNGHILHAIAVALRDSTDLNATLLGEAVEYHDCENIGWSIDTPVGPISPVLHDASARSPEDLGAALADLTARSISGRLEPEELKDGTFTVRDDGATGLTWATPAINRPQVAAVSVGTVRSQVIVVDGRVTTRDVVSLTLAYDRRVIDPGAAAAFLVRVQAALNG